MKYLFKLTCSLAILGLGACTTTLEVEDEVPVIENSVTDLSVEKDGSITLSLEHLSVKDKNGDELTLVVLEGENYTVSGTTVIPNEGFVGDLNVNVQATDGTSNSETVIVIVSVVNIVELMPFITGSEWVYRDSAIGSDTTLTSTMSIGAARTMEIGGVSQKVFNVSWSHLSEYEVNYLMSTNDSGVVMWGGNSPTDTLMDTQTLYKYPVALGDVWDYSSLKYSANDRRFFQPIASKMTCTDTALYVTVPAGSFKSYEFSLNYKVAGNASVSGTGVATPEGVDSLDVVEKMYYSVGVGYIKNVTTVDGAVVWNKELTSYGVVEKAVAQ